MSGVWRTAKSPFSDKGSAEFLSASDIKDNIIRSLQDRVDRTRALEDELNAMRQKVQQGEDLQQQLQKQLLLALEENEFCQRKIKKLQMHNDELLERTNQCEHQIQEAKDSCEEHRNSSIAHQRARILADIRIANIRNCVTEAWKFFNRVSAQRQLASRTAWLFQAWALWTRTQKQVWWISTATSDHAYELLTRQAFFAWSTYAKMRSYVEKMERQSTGLRDLKDQLNVKILERETGWRRWGTPPTNTASEDLLLDELPEATVDEAFDCEADGNEVETPHLSTSNDEAYAAFSDQSRASHDGDSDRSRISYGSESEVACGNAFYECESHPGSDLFEPRFAMRSHLFTSPFEPSYVQRFASFADSRSTHSADSTNDVSPIPASVLGHAAAVEPQKVWLSAQFFDSSWTPYTVQDSLRRSQSPASENKCCPVQTIIDAAPSPAFTDTAPPKSPLSPPVPVESQLSDARTSDQVKKPVRVVLSTYSAQDPRARTFAPHTARLPTRKLDGGWGSPKRSISTTASIRRSLSAVSGLKGMEFNLRRSSSSGPSQRFTRQSSTPKIGVEGFCSPFRSLTPNASAIRPFVFSPTKASLRTGIRPPQSCPQPAHRVDCPDRSDDDATVGDDHSQRHASILSPKAKNIRISPFPRLNLSQLRWNADVSRVSKIVPSIGSPRVMSHSPSRVRLACLTGRML